MDDLSEGIAAQRDLFLRRLERVRPRLHRYCSKMLGSPLDGEDLVQEVLCHAFYKLPTLKDPERLEPWLFRMAHNMTIDQLRRRHAFAPQQDEEGLETDGTTKNPREIREALASLISQLPPMERAAVILKDVLDQSLEDIAQTVGSNVGAVKSALHRGRAKLEHLESTQEDDRQPPEQSLDASERQLVSAYLERFNARNWDGMIDLLGADARLEVLGFADADAASILRTGYSKNYAAFEFQWRFALALVDGKEEVVHFRQDPQGRWRPVAALRLDVRQGRIVHIRDYIHVEYLLDGARVEELGEPVA